jgi:hypothetical protein
VGCVFHRTFGGASELEMVRGHRHAIVLFELRFTDFRLLREGNLRVVGAERAEDLQEQRRDFDHHHQQEDAPHRAPHAGTLVVQLGERLPPRQVAGAECGPVGGQLVADPKLRFIEPPL